MALASSLSEGLSISKSTSSSNFYEDSWCNVLSFFVLEFEVLKTRQHRHSACEDSCCFDFMTSSSLLRPSSKCLFLCSIESLTELFRSATLISESSILWITSSSEGIEYKCPFKIERISEERSLRSCEYYGIGISNVSASNFPSRLSESAKT